jgi:hypothetical protein
VTSPKYPRTYHTPFSPGLKNDDRRVDTIDHWLNRPVMLTEKMDGSNLCFERDNVYSRSHSKYPVHESFNMAKGEWQRVRYQIPEGVQVFGEWLFAKHSIHYLDLPAYFMIFGVHDLRNDMWWDWLGVKYFAAELGFPTVPVLGTATCATASQLEAAILSTISSRQTEEHPVEGIVNRPDVTEQCFPDSEFARKLCKWVRKDHIQTDEHWTRQAIVRNCLRRPI